MITHLYTMKQYGRPSSAYTGSETRVRLLCSKQYIVHESKPFYSNAVTVPARVTCVDCLKILIPQEEQLLNEMRANLLSGLDAVGETQ